MLIPNQAVCIQIIIVNNSDVDFDAPVLSNLSILPSSTVDITSGGVP